MRVVTYPSPNFNARPGPLDAVVLHATADTDGEASVHWCADPASKVSYHVIVDRDGVVYALVDVLKRAWHAGVSSFQGRPNCNDYAIGVSFANRNDGKEPYPEIQLAVAAALVAGYMRRFPAITIDRITTHAIVAPTRKTDPRPPAFNLAAFKLRVLGELQGGQGAHSA